jgi:hypothetical protein
MVHLCLVPPCCCCWDLDMNIILTCRPTILEWFWVEQKNAVEFAVRKLGNGSINYPSRNVATMEIDFLSYRPADED